MQLEDFKANWGVLNERLEKGELINQKILHEMILQRTHTAQDKLLKRHLSGLLISVLAMGFFFWTYLTQNTINLEGLIVLETVLLITVYIRSMIIFYLYRLDIKKESIVKLNYCIIKYKWWMRISNTVGMGVVITGIILFFIIQNVVITINGVAFLICVALLTTLNAVIMFRLLKKEFSNIEEGIKELEELEN